MGDALRTVYLEDLVVGEVQESDGLVVDGDEMLAYNRLNDPEPFHVDEEAARASPFGGLIASGGFTISLFYRLGHAARRAAGTRLAFLGGFDWHVKFEQPVRPGDELRLRSTLLEKRESSKPGRGVARSREELLNQEDQVVLSIEIVFLVASRPGP